MVLTVPTWRLPICLLRDLTPAQVFCNLHTTSCLWSCRQGDAKWYHSLRTHRTCANRHAPFICTLTDSNGRVLLIIKKNKKRYDCYSLLNHYFERLSNYRQIRRMIGVEDFLSFDPWLERERNFCSIYPYFWHFHIRFGSLLYAHLDLIDPLTPVNAEQIGLSLY